MATKINVKRTIDCAPLNSSLEKTRSLNWSIGKSACAQDLNISYSAFYELIYQLGTERELAWFIWNH